MRATKDNEHFTEWFSEVMRYVMGEEAREKLRREATPPSPEPPRYHHHRA